MFYPGFFMKTGGQDENFIKAVKNDLASACPVKGVLHRVTELLYLARPTAMT